MWRPAILAPISGFRFNCDITFGYVSSGISYRGQWVDVPVVLGVPPDWDGTGDYPTAQIEVFAVDKPSDFKGGMFGVGFGIIDAQANGGPGRNPLLDISYRGAPLKHGYIIGAEGVELGLTPTNTAGFAFISLEPNGSPDDFFQPLASYGVSGVVSGTPFALAGDLPLLVDTGISHMILWLDAHGALPPLNSGAEFPTGISVRLSAPSTDSGDAPVLQYRSRRRRQPAHGPDLRRIGPGTGINTGVHVLKTNDYLFDATAGRIGFRVRPNGRQ